MPDLDGPRWGPASKGRAKQIVFLLHGLGADGNDLIDLAPRWSQALSSNPARSGMKLVSHILRPGRTGMNSPSPLKYLAAPWRSGKA